MNHDVSGVTPYIRSISRAEMPFFAEHICTMTMSQVRSGTLVRGRWSRSEPRIACGTWRTSKLVARSESASRPAWAFPSHGCRFWG